MILTLFIVFLSLGVYLGAVAALSPREPLTRAYVPRHAGVGRLVDQSPYERDLFQEIARSWSEHTEHWWIGDVIVKGA